MAQIALTSWQAFRNSFKIGDRYIWSIIWFRLQAALGTLLGIFALIEPQLLVDLIGPKGVAVFVIVNALGSEYLRRRKAKEEG